MTQRITTILPSEIAGLTASTVAVIAHNAHLPGRHGLRPENSPPLSGSLVKRNVAWSTMLDAVLHIAPSTWLVNLGMEVHT
jgi:hypothetical protein